MWKKIFAASAALAGILCIAECNNVYATATHEAYNPYETKSIFDGTVNVCVNKTSGYDGDLIVADIQGTGYNVQLSFDKTTNNENCKTVKNIPAGSTIKYMTPMGLSGLYFDTTDGANQRVALNLDDSNLGSKYLRGYGFVKYDIEAAKIQIAFNANGGVGDTATMTSVAPGAEIVLSSNGYSRNGFVFAGWNTEADGSGQHYYDGEKVRLYANSTLYAQWKAPSVAILDKGSSVGIKLKTMAKGESVKYYTADNLIKEVVSSDVMPSDIDPDDESHIISDLDNSSVRIYAWFDNSDDKGQIKIYTSAATIRGNADMSYLFYNYASLENISAVHDWDMSETTKIYSMFERASSLKKVDALEQWDVSNVKEMYSIFNSATGLEDITGLSKWNVSNVELMYGFMSNTSITNLDALATTQRDGYKSWDINTLIDWGLSGAFSNNPKLESIEGLRNWNVSSVTNITSAFANDILLKDISPLSNWDVSNVRYMSYLFQNDTSLESLSGLEDWDTSNVEEMQRMFNNDSALVDISALAKWNASKVTTMQYMFYGAGITNVDALATVQRDGYKSWDVVKLEDMEAMFRYSPSLENLDGLSGWRTPALTTLFYTFADCVSLNDISGLEDWDVSNVENMNVTFAHSPSIEDITPLAKWNVSKVTNFSSMFSSTSIKNLDALATTQRDGYKSWDIKAATALHDMFGNIVTLTDISGLKDWDTSSVTDMSQLFRGSVGINDISWLANWNVSNVTTMRDMFRSLSAITDTTSLNAWTPRSDCNKTDMFKGVPSSAGRPSWY